MAGYRTQNPIEKETDKTKISTTADRSINARKRIYIIAAALLALFLGAMDALIVFLLGGRTYAWHSIPIIILAIVSVLAAGAFYYVEKHARDPILSLRFFEIKGFRIGNAAVFLSSFTIFSLFAFAPLSRQRFFPG